MGGRCHNMATSTIYCIRKAKITALMEVPVKMPTFTPANPVAQRNALIAINVEYLSWVAAEAEAYFGITHRPVSA